MDLERAQLVRRPEYPLLVAALVARLLPRSAEEGGIFAARAGGSSTIAPRPLVAGRYPDPAQAGGRGRALAPWLIVLALAVLLLDILILWRRRRYHR